MPNIKSAKKRVITDAKKGVSNKSQNSAMKTAIKNVEKEAKHGNNETVSEKLKVAIKTIDKACSSGLIHKNKAAREKSRLTKIKNNVK
ncbi:MAG: 30S ribosomal protein S20 [bacterium]|nr:30S ribosomal protein S20 [bacterium]